MKQIVLFFLLLIPMGGLAQSEDVMVLKAIEEAKTLIAQKQYSNAQGRLEDMRVFGVYTDSIDYYIKVIDYHIDLDSVEALYKKKRFQEARRMYDIVFSRHKGVITSKPTWILRCDTIIEAQNAGNTITPNLAKALSMYGYPFQGFADGFTFVRLGGDYYRVIKKNGETFDFVLPDKAMIFGYSEGYATFKYALQNEPWIGYVDMKGHVALKLKYDFGGNFHDGMAVVRKGNKWGYIDKAGMEVIPCQYDYAGDFSEKLALVMVKDKDFFKAMYINRTGHVIMDEVNGKKIPCLYNSNSPNPINTDFSEGLAFDGMGNFFSTDGQLIFKCVQRYRRDSFGWKKDRDFPHPFSCGRALAAVGKTDKDSKYGFIDKIGNEIIPVEYDDAYDFSENYAWVCKGNRYGCINTEGKLVIDYQYESVGYTDDGRKRGIYTGFYKFSEGLAGVKKNGKWGFVDYSGNIVIPFEYDEVFNFSEGFAWVKKKGKWGLVDKFGTTTFDF